VKLGLGVVVLAFWVPGTPQIVRQPASHQFLQKVKLFRHQATLVWSCRSGDVDGIVYQAGLAVDADGAFRAYHPDNRLGLDTIEHAGRPGNWWALETDNGKSSGRPLLQRDSDPAPGYYVSMTALFDASNPDERDPRRFVDASSVPYVVLPPAGLRHVKLGDLATVVRLRSGKTSGAIVADESAPEVKMGEGSIALARSLGIDWNPRTGGIEEGIAYVIFPGSGNGEPRRLDEITSISARRFKKWGGLKTLTSCLH
jgi:hypothetical protein